MGERFQIHNFESMIRSALSGIKSSRRISEKNKEIIERFYQQCITEGMSSSRALKYLYTLKKLALLLGKDFDKAGVRRLFEKFFEGAMRGRSTRG